jgi:plasmid stabilization system protein ParE
MKVVLSENALFMADAILSDSRSLFGEKAFRKLRDKIAQSLKRIEWSTRYGSLEPALADEEGEYRFVLLNDRFKMIYRIVDEEHIRILTFWDMKQNPENMRLFL